MSTLSAPPMANCAHDVDHAVLARIHEPEINIAVWHRERVIPVDVLERVLLAMPGELRASGCVTNIIRQLEEKLSVLGFEAGALVDDIALVLDHFAQVSGVKQLRCSLSPVNTNMCRRFHTDVNDLRLLCTYVGPGTLWLPNEAVNDEVIRTNDWSRPIERGAEDVQQVGTGHVAILKGAVYPGERVKACVHRSPTIEETDEHRLLLRIDTNEPLFAFQ